MKIVDQIIITTDNNRPKKAPPASSELGNSLLDLLSSTKKKKKEPEITDPFYYGEMPEEKEVVQKKDKKKDKKIKKKKDKKGSVLSELGVDIMYAGSVLTPIDDEEEDEIVDDGNPNQIDIDRIFEDDEDDDEMGNIIYDQRKSYKKNKNSEGYSSHFAEELTLLYGLLEETNTFGADLDKIYRAMINSKTRGFSKNTTELINSILSSKQAKLSVLKEISSVKKTIADLTLKESKSSGDNGAAGGVNTLAASYLNNIIKHGRNNFVNAMNGNEEYEQRSEEIDDFVSRVGDYEDDEERQYINDEIMESLESGDSRYNIRSSASDSYIRNEINEVTVKVERNIGSGDWEFVAIDKNGLRVFDYPLPSKATVSPVKFTSDGTFCTDRYGRSYKVIDTV